MTQLKSKLLTVTVIFSVLLTLLWFIQNNDHNAQPLTTENKPTNKAITLEPKSPNQSESNLTKSTEQLTEPDKPVNDGQLTIKQRPSWRLAPNVITHWQNLKTAAAQGDTKANYILAMNYRHCYYVPTSESALELKLQQIYQFSDSDTAARQLNDKYHYCQGIDPHHRNQFYQHLENAANKNLVAAQEEIGNITTKQYMQSKGYNDLERDAYIAKRDAFTAQKLQFLRQASQQGSIKALIKLSNLHHSQNYGPYGYVKTYALNQIILELTPDNELQNRYSWFQQKAYSQLKPEEIEQAQEMAEQWLTAINTNGTLYLSQ